MPSYDSDEVESIFEQVASLAYVVSGIHKFLEMESHIHIIVDVYLKTTM